MTQASPIRPPTGPVPFSEALKVWSRIAALSFGGPAGQIAVMHRILVEEKRWLGEQRFLHALNYCMLLPGPEAQQLAIYIGWLMHRTLGGLVAGLLFVLPGFVAIMGLSILYMMLGEVGPVAAIFFGLKSAVLVIVVQALLRIGGRALRNRTLMAVAAAAFLAIAVFGVAFPLIILAAGLIGFFGARAGLPGFSIGGGHGDVAAGGVADIETVLGESQPEHTKPNLAWALRMAAVILLLWLAPVLALGLTLGWDNVFTQIAVFFTKMAVVTFGGAYAVLAYVAQEAVQTYGWLRPGEMLDGLALAETTPGPLIMVTQFVGFLGAARNATGLDPLWAGVLGGMLTTWVTFTPCFLWIFLGAPFVEALRSARALNAALATITAAVVGVILNLALWFALHVLFAQMRDAGPSWVALNLPVLSSVNLASLGLTLAAAVAAFAFRIGVVPLLLGCAAAGLALYGAGLLT
ncbi:chromate efflux transporter [Phenylobacterium sp.]|uniref:chromate efflux transporter n=1 Tax=Phenylobacterium sp. TaxID=1871053 RepID=UPI0027303215|nr:chromate efflux transporter [Phenylobacterium sp.]MDP1873209.1 chromate efflux transporter [Phenylobacterium sp.]MDP3490592.1 chromate efflux transporter [Phenylobacterium sp.]